MTLFAGGTGVCSGTIAPKTCTLPPRSLNTALREDTATVAAGTVTTQERTPIRRSWFRTTRDTCAWTVPPIGNSSPNSSLAVALTHVFPLVWVTLRHTPPTSIRTPVSLHLSDAVKLTIQRRRWSTSGAVDSTSQSQGASGMHPTLHSPRPPCARTVANPPWLKYSNNFWS